MGFITIEEVDILNVESCVGCGGRINKIEVFTSWEIRRLPALVAYSGPSIGLEIKLAGYGTAIEVATANEVARG